MSELEKLRKLILESDPALVAVYKTKMIDVPYDTGKVFSSADFLKHATRPADNKHNTDPLDDIINSIDPEDEDVIELLKLNAKDYDCDPWDDMNESHGGGGGGHGGNPGGIPDGGVTAHSSPGSMGVSVEEFHALIRQYLDAGYSEYMARHKAMERLGQV